eukprot:tig00000402_g214.t1
MSTSFAGPAVLPGAAKRMPVALRPFVVASAPLPAASNSESAVRTRSQFLGKALARQQRVACFSGPRRRPEFLDWGRNALHVRASNVAESKPSAAPGSEIPSTFDPSSVEERLYKFWEESGFFTPTPDPSKAPYVIAMPPPNVTGALHMGHAMFVTLQDILTRYKRMQGTPTLWLPGTDHAGIATQLLVERWLAAEEKIKRQEIGREEFVKRVWEWKEKYGGTITGQLRRLGASCDWSREKFTLDKDLSEAVIESFVRLHEDGLIYRSTYLVNWSPNLQTAVSDLEVEYSEEPGTLYTFKYPLKDSDEFIPVATTRPETILGDTAVAVHPEDPRYKKYIGKMLVVPLIGREIPVIADTYVDREFGTGALKITPGHDPNDYDIGKKHNLPIINIMNKDATLNENGGKFAGKERFEVRKELWADMEKLGLTIKTEPHTLRVPRSQRGGEVIEPMVSTQWFVRMEPLAKPALEAVRTGDIKIVPERFEKIYFNWLENIRDWCISRQLWWGHRIPVWYVKGQKGDDGEEPFVVARTEEAAYEKAREKYGKDVVLEQDPDVLDTWFSSGLWPFSTLGWPNEKSEDFYFYPTAVMETGYDILFFWVARMIMTGIYFTGKSPFKIVYLHGLVRDSQGRKMSKTLGNVIDPLDVMKDFGTDSLRFTLATSNTPGQDVNLSLERVESNRNFANKMWNAGRFVLSDLAKASQEELSEIQALIEKHTDKKYVDSLALPERWIISRLHTLVDEVSENLDALSMGEAGRSLYDFFWTEFADWFIEASKTRLYGQDAKAKQQARATLVYVLDRSMRLLHPFMPFVTEEIWSFLPRAAGVKEPSLIVGAWPARGLPVDSTALEQFEALQNLVRSIRNARAEYNVEPGKRIAAEVQVQDAAMCSALSAERSVLVSLAKLDDSQVGIGPNCGANLTTQEAVPLVVAEGLEAFLPLKGMVDLEKERQRLTKQAAKIEKELEGLQKRLNSPGFTDKAPADVVASVKDNVADLSERLRIIKERMASL